MYIRNWKNPMWKGYKLCDSKYMTFWKRQNYGDRRKISSCQGLGEKGWQVKHRGFLGQWDYSYDADMVDTLVKSHRMYTRNSLAVQWLGFHACTAGGTGSIPGWGPKILQARRHGQKRKQCTMYKVIMISMSCLRAQSCPTLCNPVDCNLPGSSVHGNFQARILGWVAISSSRWSWPRDRTLSSPELLGRFFTTLPPGKPLIST